MNTQFLIDKHLIEENFALYGQLVDEKRFDELDHIFTTDVTMTIMQPKHFELVGLDTVVGGMNQRLGADAGCAVTHHNMTNLSLTVDGDVAQSRANFVAWHTGRGVYEGNLYFMGGAYEDRWRRTAAGWRVAHRVFHIQLAHGEARMMW